MVHFAKLSTIADAVALINECGYYAPVEHADLVGTDVYGMVRQHGRQMELVACVVILRMGAQAYLDYLVVAGSMRNTGVATTLLEHVAQDLRKYKVRVVHLCISGENGASAKLLSKYGAKVGWPYINGTVRLEEDHGQ